MQAKPQKKNVLRQLGKVIKKPQDWHFRAKAFLFHKVSTCFIWVSSPSTTLGKSPRSSSLPPRTLYDFPPHVTQSKSTPKATLNNYFRLLRHCTVYITLHTLSQSSNFFPASNIQENQTSSCPSIFLWTVLLHQQRLQARFCQFDHRQRCSCWNRSLHVQASGTHEKWQIGLWNSVSSVPNIHKPHLLLQKHNGYKGGQQLFSSAKIPLKSLNSNWPVRLSKHADSSEGCTNYAVHIKASNIVTPSSWRTEWWKFNLHHMGKQTANWKKGLLISICHTTYKKTLK